MRNAFINSLLEHAKKDQKLNLVVGDLGYGVIDEFEKVLPNQFLNAGVAEQSMIGLSAGMASTGKRVFAYSIANFPTFRALEQIRNDVCYHNLPVTIVSVGAGLGYGVLGYSHYAIEDLAVMRAMPNLDIYSPIDSVDAERCLKEIVSNYRPSYIRIGKGGEKQIFQNNDEIQVGYNVLRPFEDEVVIVTGSIAQNVLEAVDSINQSDNKQIGIIAVNKLNNLELPVELFASKTKIVTVEEHILIGGLRSAVLETLSATFKPCTVVPIGISSPTMSIVGSQEYVRESHGLSVAGLRKQLLEVF